MKKKKSNPSNTKQMKPFKQKQVFLFIHSFLWAGQPALLHSNSTHKNKIYFWRLVFPFINRTVIISIYFIPFVLSLINQMKFTNWKIFLLICELIDGWLKKENSCCLHWRTSFFKLRHKRLYVVGPAASLINSSINSFTSLFNKSNQTSLFFSSS